MELLGSIITIIFVAVVIATALTLGATLLLTIIGVSIIMGLFFVLRGYWLRWRFLHYANKQEKEAQQSSRVTIIETSYKDITDL